LSKLVPDIQISALLLEGLTSHVENQLDQIDYDRRIEAYLKVNKDFLKNKRLGEIEILLHACLFDTVGKKDSVPRRAAADALQK